MFKVGAHFGYSKTRRHPSTRQYIFGTKNKNDIIDLEKTDELLASTLAYIAELGKGLKTVLFVGAKPEAKHKIEEVARILDMPYVIERWIGGTITNFPEIKKRIAKLEDLREKKEKGELDMYTKKERLLIDIDVARMSKFFGGLVTLKKAPDALVVIDPKREHIAVTEAHKAGIPVIALANSDTNIKGLEHCVVANDASRGSVAFFLEEMQKAYQSGKITKE